MHSPDYCVPITENANACCPRIARSYELRLCSCMSTFYINRLILTVRLCYINDDIMLFFFPPLTFLLSPHSLFFYFSTYRFNYRSTHHLSTNGFYEFLNWFDERAWYPLGRIVGGTVRTL